MSFRTVLARTALAMALAIGGVAGAQEVVPEGYDAELWLEGRRAFDEVGGMGCAGCHGRYGANELGGTPELRGDVDVTRIHGAVQGMQAMVFLQALITDAEIEAIAYYLGYLGTMQPVLVTMRRGEFDTPTATIPAGIHVQLILYNQDRGTCTWTVEGSDADAVDANPIDVDGRTVGAVDWVTGASGTYEAFCAGAPETRFTLSVE